MCLIRTYSIHATRTHPNSRDRYARCLRFCLRCCSVAPSFRGDECGAEVKEGPPPTRYATIFSFTHSRLRGQLGAIPWFPTLPSVLRLGLGFGNRSSRLRGRLRAIPGVQALRLGLGLGIGLDGVRARCLVPVSRAVRAVATGIDEVYGVKGYLGLGFNTPREMLLQGFAVGASWAVRTG